MGKPYSEDLRRSVVEGIESGMTYEEVSESCGVSISSVSRFLTRWRSTGSVSAAKFGGYKGYALEPHKDSIVRWITAQPDLTLSELEARLAERNVVVSQAAIFRFLRHLGLTFKKKVCTRPNKTGPTSPRRVKRGSRCRHGSIRGS
jgi:transposase